MFLPNATRRPAREATQQEHQDGLRAEPIDTTQAPHGLPGGCVERIAITVQVLAEEAFEQRGVVTPAVGTEDKELNPLRYPVTPASTQAGPHHIGLMLGNNAHGSSSYRSERCELPFKTCSLHFLI